MEKFASFLERKIMSVAAKISNQRHMRAVRAGIIATLPLTIVGSFFTILLNIPIDAYMDFIAPFKATLDIPFRYTVGFLSLYATLALVVMFMFSKSQYLKSLGRLGFLPGLFNINEPIIFGAPIVMNPILGIPFIIGPIIMTILSYVLTITGVIPMMVARLPFAMPAPIAAVMSTNWSILAGILVLINFVISFAVYYPFFKVFEKQQLQREQEEMSENL
ncbi:PTS transporter subunit EIIC [Clostridioides difficile]|uniref:PTS transporter subunit EIIC n=1 Tax=Clostridioides difficile TaxID=1496 RepID=UPI00082450A7|nr:PTS transporter subunit EIIC [Clostridioides difficile]MCJ0406301.1 PTS transporter subunit EIIC [Clostridioides difficile]MCK3749225.1 PTS transporter subunit EIIC [Clostridioides difficile]MCP8398517.1 PTS transporter subunit EIIC [Clostridioides difficile]MCP8415871.1 PTS transporter subunit EIIC [Clostridioides difficile]MCP8494847.1 PTS transporter subunit EIIC [Clostridioides difficile]